MVQLFLKAGNKIYAFKLTILLQAYKPKYFSILQILTNQEVKQFSFFLILRSGTHYKDMKKMS